MGIKETPTNFRVYYTSMRNAYTQKREDIIASLAELRAACRILHESVKEDYCLYKDDYGYNIMLSKEFVDNTYIDGTFLKVAKGLFANRGNNYTLVGCLFDLYRLAKMQYDIYKLSNDYKLCEKMLALSIKEYTEILRLYYTEVHKKLIIDGNGYVFDHNIGWICINRCKLVDKKTRIDYKATKKNKEKLIAEGKRIYNKEEAEWCKNNNIEYNAVDGRVFQNLEYVYEIPLIGCKLPNGSKFKLTISDYIATKLRQYSNEQLLELCEKDKDKIIQLPIDLRYKLYLCLDADKLLYTKFIRNEYQVSFTTSKINRKNRQ